MAKRLWEKIGDKIIQLLDQNAGYELIVTGHDLSGGSTCCVNLILHNDDERMEGRKDESSAALPTMHRPSMCPSPKSPRRHKLASTILISTMLYHSCAATQFATKCQ